MEASEFIALFILGLLAGGAASSVMRFFGTGPRFGGWPLHAAIGIVGAWVGGFLFAALEIDVPEIFSGTIEVADMFVAFIGAIVVIFAVGIIRKK